METACRVMILEDDPIQCQLLESWLGMMPDVQCIGCAPTVKKAFPILFAYQTWMA
jgi:response regulator of citrate/malate metabolism